MPPAHCQLSFFARLRSACCFESFAVLSDVAQLHEGFELSLQPPQFDLPAVPADHHRRRAVAQALQILQARRIAVGRHVPIALLARAAYLTGSDGGPLQPKVVEWVV